MAKPIAWRYRGPKGGWIMVEQKPPESYDDVQPLHAAVEIDFPPALGAVCRVLEYGKSDGTKDYFVSVRVGDREITPHKFTIRGRAEYEVAEWDWLLNGGEKPDILDWLDRTAETGQGVPNDG